MNILIIDGHGGQLGAQLVKAVKAKFKNVSITAIGTNAIATSAMLKAGADIGATGENPVLVNAKSADVIIGPIGIVIADSLYGEISDKMANAVSKAQALRILIPINRCDNLIAGIRDVNTKELIEDALVKLEEYIGSIDKPKSD